MAVVQSITHPVPLPVRAGQDPVCLTIYPETPGSLHRIPSEEAEAYAEAEYQLEEGRGYEYSFSAPGCHLEPVSGIVQPFRSGRNSGGRITPGIYTGTIRIRILGARSEPVDTLNLEVRSVKTGYRTDYRTMLGEITEACTDLLMQHSSPAVQRFIPDQEQSSRTLYQRFAFIGSILLSDDFQAAFHKILGAPVVRWDEAEREVDIRNPGRISRSVVRQFASASRRRPVPSGHPLAVSIAALPERLRVTSVHESHDTPENRFIKHVLGTFLAFITGVKGNMDPSSRAFREAAACEQLLGELTGHALFKEIGNPEFLALNSPVLQRREGYREVYRTWLMFDAAASLVWKGNRITGSEDAYDAGKRDIAVLYEYWVFFKLLDICRGLFSLDSRPADELLEQTADGLGLKLRSGRGTAIAGTCDAFGRRLRVRLSYNRTYPGNSPYPGKGSWTLTMRPDYTLSIWPDALSEDEAEEHELMLHLHFDAKYRVTDYRSLLQDPPDRSDDGKMDETGDPIVEDLPQLGTDDQRALYRRMDILKMHAYKDAIRRSAGAYILYPGTEQLMRGDFQRRSEDLAQGFHEIIPGLGAFAIRPDPLNNGTADLAAFIGKVLSRFMLQTARHERLSYHRHAIYRENWPHPLLPPFPEKRIAAGDDYSGHPAGALGHPAGALGHPAGVFGHPAGVFGHPAGALGHPAGVFGHPAGVSRMPPPNETSVLVGYIREKQRSWVNSRGLYNIRFDQPVSSAMTGAEYLALYDAGHESLAFFHLTGRPEIWGRDRLLASGYPEPGSPEYFVYPIVPVQEALPPWGRRNIRRLLEKFGAVPYRPFTVTLEELGQVWVERESG